MAAESPPWASVAWPESPAAIDPATWPESAHWRARAARLGSLRWSDLGPRRLFPPPDAAAAWLTGRLDRWWADAGRPDPWTVVVASGDDGRLARAVLDSAGECLTALRYVMVGAEANPDLSLPVEEPFLMFPAGPAEDGDDRPEPVPRVGPLMTTLAELPSGFDWPVAVIAAGYLNSLPCDVVSFGGGQWWEHRVTVLPSGILEEVKVPAGLDLGPVAFGRHRLLTGAIAWMRRALGTAPGGVLAVIDDWSQSGLDLRQLSRVRAPLDDSPERVGEGAAAVEWRIG